jgi:hypothetical protein
MQNKTAKTPAEYLTSLNEPRKSELRKLHSLIRKTAPKLKPFIGRGMIGYGPYHYVYASGREGDSARIGLASQKHYISLYVECIDGKYRVEEYRDQLPKASIGKCCIRFKKLADVDLKVIEALIKKAAVSK